MSEEIISAVLIKSSIKSLEDTIKEADRQNQKLQKTMVWLAIITAILTLVQVINIFFIKWDLPV